MAYEATKTGVIVILYLLGVISIFLLINFWAGIATVLGIILITIGIILQKLWKIPFYKKKESKLT